MYKMKKSKELANCIGSFIEKYYSSQVSLPECELPINGVYKVNIDEEKLEKVSNLWKFEGTALFSFADSDVKLNVQRTIIGNASVTSYPNAINPKEMLPNVVSVTITEIK